MNGVSRRRWLATMGLSALSYGPAAWSQSSYPTRPIRMLVGFSAGGSIDIAARVVAENLGARLGQSVVVENKPGASGMLAGGMAAHATPDGYTLLLASTGALTITPHFTANPTYDPIKDFEAIGRVAITDAVLVINPKVPIKTFADFLASAKQEPSKYFFASSGSAGPTHLAGELLKRSAHVDISHVPFSGDAPAALAVISGTVSTGIIVMPTAAPYLKSGQLRALATMGEKRSAEFPDVPTVAETFPGFSGGAWYVLMAPKNTPAHIVSLLSKQLEAVLADPAVVARMTAARLGPFPSKSPTAARQYIESESEKWGQIIKDAKITVNN